MCSNPREFRRFSEYFRHITVFHQNESRFRIVCNLHQTCGNLYRTFSAYKSHVYRHHESDLHPINEQPPDTHSPFNHQQDELDENLESNSIEVTLGEEIDSPGDDEFGLQEDNDSDLIHVEELLGKNGHQEDNEITMSYIVKSFALFILQLREDFLLPKTTMNTITNYIITLIENLQVFLRRNVIHCPSTDSASKSTTSKSSIEMIPLRSIEELVKSISQQLQGITKSEYRFVQNCQEIFGYAPPVEIIINDETSDEESEIGYFIPIEQTLSRMLTNDQMLSRILHHIDREKRSSMLNDDLMFSFRDGHFGTRIDDDSLLIQLYLDDIGVSNPIGAKKDSNKLTMIYFSLEDIPDEYRSKIDFI